MTEKIKELPVKVGCDRGLCHQAVGRQDRQLNTYDWLADVPGNQDTTDGWLTCLATRTPPTSWKCSSSTPVRAITIM